MYCPVICYTVRRELYLSCLQMVSLVSWSGSMLQQAVVWCAWLLLWQTSSKSCRLVLQNYSFRGSYCHSLDPGRLVWVACLMRRLIHPPWTSMESRTIAGCSKKWMWVWTSCTASTFAHAFCHSCAVCAGWTFFALFCIMFLSTESLLACQLHCHNKCACLQTFAPIHWWSTIYMHPTNMLCTCAACTEGKAEW